jgi:hypothetical protein
MNASTDALLPEELHVDVGQLRTDPTAHTWNLHCLSSVLHRIGGVWPSISVGVPSLNVDRNVVVMIPAFGGTVANWNVSRTLAGAAGSIHGPPHLMTPPIEHEAVDCVSTQSVNGQPDVCALAVTNHREVAQVVDRVVDEMTLEDDVAVAVDHGEGELLLAVEAWVARQ